MADPLTLAVVGSSVLSAGGKVAGGIAANKDAKREAAATYANATRQAYESRREGDVLESNARAIAAAGGGVASDAGFIERVGEIQRDTDYNSLAALYEGKTRAKQIRRKGKRAKIAGFVGGASSILDGAASIYQGKKLKEVGA